MIRLVLLIGLLLPSLTMSGSPVGQRTIEQVLAERFAALAEVTDRSDGKLAHLDGLHLSRAWMLEGIASGLPPGDPKIEVLAATAVHHRQAGIAAVTGEHYAGGHWLGSFATYLVTRCGIHTSAP